MPHAPAIIRNFTSMQMVHAHTHTSVFDKESSTDPLACKQNRFYFLTQLNSGKMCTASCHTQTGRGAQGDINEKLIAVFNRQLPDWQRNMISYDITPGSARPALGRKFRKYDMPIGNQWPIGKFLRHNQRMVAENSYEMT